MSYRTAAVGDVGDLGVPRWVGAADGVSAGAVVDCTNVFEQNLGGRPTPPIVVCRLLNRINDRKNNSKLIFY